MIALAAGLLAPAEESFPINAVFQRGNAQESKDTGEADDGIRSNRGTERKQNCGNSDKAGEDREC